MTAREQSLPPRQRGGKRPGAGRKSTGDKAGNPHTKRLEFDSKMLVHVTMPMLPHVGSLRGRRSLRVLEDALAAAAVRFGTRLCELSIQGDHLHLVVEAGSQAELSQAMQGLGVRIARGLNRVMGRKGKVFADRYHAQVLRSPPRRNPAEKL